MLEADKMLGDAAEVLAAEVNSAQEDAPDINSSDSTNSKSESEHVPGFDMWVGNTEVSILHLYGKCHTMLSNL